MANTALSFSSSTITHDAFAPPISNIDSKCHTKKLKSSRTCLIGYSGFISREWFLIAWGRTHTHMHIYRLRRRKQPGLTKYIEKVIPRVYIPCAKCWQWKTLVVNYTENYLSKKYIGDLASFTTLLAKKRWRMFMMHRFSITLYTKIPRLSAG